jgi:hypothetical protein
VCITPTTRLVEPQMTAIRMAIAAVLATAAVLAGGATVPRHGLHATAHPPTMTEAGPIPCCEE